MRVRTRMFRHVVQILIITLSIAAAVPFGTSAQATPQAAMDCLEVGDSKPASDADALVDACNLTFSGGQDDDGAGDHEGTCPRGATPTGQDGDSIGGACAATPADDAAARCEQAAIAAEVEELYSYNLVPGTEANEDLSTFLTTDKDLVCGFGGSDFLNSLDEGDVFLGGDGSDKVVSMTGGIFIGDEGNDAVQDLNDGIFNGGRGDDTVCTLSGGIFNGGEGSDLVATVDGGVFDGGDGKDFVCTLSGGIFNGGAENDTVRDVLGGIFNGGDGDDLVSILSGGTVNGGDGDDRVAILDAGVFNGGDGDDDVLTRNDGTFNE